MRPQATLYLLPKVECQRVLKAFEAWRSVQATPPCGPALDVAQRVAGVGSLGVPRYIVLAKHHRPRKKLLLLDLKSPCHGQPRYRSSAATMALGGAPGRASSDLAPGRTAGLAPGGVIG